MDAHSNASPTSPLAHMRKTKRNALPSSQSAPMLNIQAMRDAGEEGGRRRKLEVSGCHNVPSAFACLLFSSLCLCSPLAPLSHTLVVSHAAYTNSPAFLSRLSLSQHTTLASARLTSTTSCPMPPSWTRPTAARQHPLQSARPLRPIRDVARWPGLAAASLWATSRRPSPPTRSPR